MSKVKEGIETALENINSASQNTYGAKVYTFEQVQMILQDLLETANEESDDGMAVLTDDMISDLVEKLEDRIDNNIDNISDSDIIDEDSLEASISGGRVSIEALDVDKANIISEAQYGIEDTITKWAAANGLNIEN